MIDTFVRLEDYINKCLLSKLSKPYHEKDYHSEYQTRNNSLEQYFPKLMELLQNVDFREQLEITSSTLYSLFILYLELETEGPWNNDSIKARDYPKTLNQLFQTKYDISLKEILTKDSFYVAQDVFDKCIKELHQKITLDDFRKYPGVIEVYCLLIKNVKEYNVSLNPVTVLPIALLLVDDYIIHNKVKGLQCCAVILSCLKCSSFAAGNYYEVVYRSLRNNLVEKDMEVTTLLFKCFPEYLKLLPPEVQKDKLDDVFSSVIDQLRMETNLYRKAECFKFTTKIIEIHGINCVKKKIFKMIIYENLDICSKDGVYEILIKHVLECLSIWVRHCWCIWKLSTDQNILSALIKILYVAKEESTIDFIQNLILTLTCLCSKEEQIQIYNNLNSVSEYIDTDFLVKLTKIKDNICT